MPTLEPIESSPADTQLRINKTTLLENKNDKNRLDAATLLLFSDNPAAREILLEVLKRTDNPGARAAVCEALNPARTWQRSLRNKEDFIKPLINIITSEEDFTIAKLAAEATLVFGYSQVQQELERAASDAALSLTVKKNVIYALKRHPDKQAVAKLIMLLDDPEPQVVEAARSALLSVGISISPDPVIRKQVLTEVQQRGTEAFLRERLVRQETRMREMETDLDRWQTRYRAMLNRLYTSLTDETAKSAFLAEQLGGQETAGRWWALDKLEELRQGTTKPKLSEQLQKILLSLISDPSREIRLRTARLLIKMTELNAAKPLLEQVKIEQDDQIRRDLFIALGGACYVASLSTAGPRVPDEVRKETLELAVGFLGDTDAEKARSGADVIGKLLEQDGLKPEELDRYLRALADRYIQAGKGTDQGLRGYLLSAMAGLCAPRSTCRIQAAKLYGDLLEQALGDTADGVRQTAVDGLINIDKPGALRRLRKDMTGDSSPIIRMKLIELAAEEGGAPDLEWLGERFNVTAESGPAWQAMVKIFGRSNAAVLADWMGRIEASTAVTKLSIEQRISFLTLVEQTAQKEGSMNLLKDVQEKLAQLYISSGNFKQAAESLRVLLSAAAKEKDKERLRAQLLTVHLAAGGIDQACELVGNCLIDKSLDLGPESLMIKTIEEYLESPASADPSVLLVAFEQIKVKDPEVAQRWRTLVSRWAERLAKAKRVEETERIDN